MASNALKIRVLQAYPVFFETNDFIVAFDFIEAEFSESDI